MAKNTYKRRHYFIDKKFQSRFILKFCIVVIVSSLLIGGMMFYLSRNSTTVAIENARVTVKRTADFILPVMIQTILIVSFFSAFVVLLLTLFVSHKISGPLYRLKREIEALKEGDLQRNFNIRDKDQLQNLAVSLNEMCISLRKKHVELKDKYKQLKHHLEEKAPSGSSQKELLGILKEIEATLDYFKS